jgi:hypothetical protein
LEYANGMSKHLCPIGTLIQVFRLLLCIPFIVGLSFRLSSVGGTQLVACLWRVTK